MEVKKKMDFDLVIEKLEKLGLEDFINVYRFRLCSQTLSPNKVAAFLQFDSDAIQIISHSPSNFSKCEELYERIQQTCQGKVKDFLEALDDTGNEHILKFIKETDFSTASASTNSNWSQSQSQSRGIWFNIPEPIDSFCGREDFLTQLYDKVKPPDRNQDGDAPKTKGNVLSQIKVVSGLGGIGKTQTVRRFIMNHEKFYNNFIWIDAETENSMRSSFLKLANEIQVPVQTSEGKSREMQEIVKEIYNKICAGGKSNLIVFDNAENFQTCKDFFPLGLASKLQSMIVILVTSRNQEWVSTIGEIEFLPLDKMTDDESLEFILKQLEIGDSPEFREESREFIELIGGLPLALQQAVAFIKHQKKEQRFWPRPYKMSDYVQEFKSSAEKLQNFPHAPDSPTTVFITWNLTLEKLKKSREGKIAIEIIQVMSFLYADKIPVEFLLQLLPLPLFRRSWNDWLRHFIQPSFSFYFRLDVDSNTAGSPRTLTADLNLLEQFSMIKITGQFLSIHRQVQFVLLQNLKKDGGLVNLFEHLVEKCEVVLKNIQLSECSDTFLNLHQIVRNRLEIVPVSVSVSVSGSGPFDDQDDYITVKHDKATALYEFGDFKGAFRLFSEVYERRQERRRNYLREEFGRDDTREENPLDTVYTFSESRPAPVTDKFLDFMSHFGHTLSAASRYSEALDLYRKVQIESVKKWGENSFTTLKAQNQLALQLLELGRHQESLKLYQETLEKQQEKYRPDHPDTIDTKHNIAALYQQQGKYEEALLLFQEVLEKRLEIQGENKLSSVSASVFSTQNQIALVHSEMGAFSEALALLEHVEERQEQVFRGFRGNHIITTKHNKATVFYKMGRFEEAAKIFDEVYERQKGDQEENHLDTVNTLEWIAMCLEQEGKFREALEKYKKVYEIRNSSLGEKHPLTLVVKNRIEKVETQLGET